MDGWIVDEWIERWKDGGWIDDEGKDRQMNEKDEGWVDG